MIKSKYNKIFINIFIVLIIFFIDRISKIFVLKVAEIQNTVDIYITSYLNIFLIWNKGIAFGLFSFADQTNYNILTIIIIFVTVIIFWMITKTKELEKLGFMMIFGGSLGNIFDRVYYSSVPDFIDIYFYNFHWFIFNVADIFISIGVMLLILLEIFIKKKI